MNIIDLYQDPPADMEAVLPDPRPECFREPFVAHRFTGDPEYGAKLYYDDSKGRLVRCDLLMHQVSGAVVWVTENIRAGAARVKAMLMPDEPCSLQGVWVYVGTAWPLGETMPEWLPYKAVPVYDMGEENPDRWEQFMDTHPGARERGYQPYLGDGIGVRDPSKFTPEELRQANEISDLLAEAVASGDRESMPEGLDEPLESDRDVRVRTLGTKREKDKSRVVSYTKRKRSDDD